MWMEQLTAGTGTPSGQIGITDQGGTAGNALINQQAMANVVANQVYQLSLPAGACGITAPTSYQFGGATVGTYNLTVMRPLVKSLFMPNAGKFHQQTTFDFGRVEILPNTCFYPIFSGSSTPTGTQFEFNIGIKYG
jgi:hypothetical protein